MMPELEPYEAQFGLETAPFPDAVLLHHSDQFLAGPGKIQIRDVGTVALGSPLLALTTEHPFTGYHFVDSDPNSIAALKSRCEASPLNDRVHIYTGDCNVVVNEIVARLKRDERRSLNLAFLDPEGLELEWKTVAKLASIRRMDLVINYPEGGLNRVMKKLVNSPEQTSVDRYFGTDAWRGIYQEWAKSHRGSVHGQLIDLYRSQLKTLGYREIRQSDKLGDEPLMRNVKRKAPLYRILFSSKHPLGKKFWHSVTRRDVWGQNRLFE
jgi:three-Cys-motif partner protein